MALIAQSCTIAAFTPRFAWSIKGNWVHRILICCSVSEMYLLSIRIYTLRKILLTQEMKKMFQQKKALTMTKIKAVFVLFHHNFHHQRKKIMTQFPPWVLWGTASQVVEWVVGDCPPLELFLRGGGFSHYLLCVYFSL